MGNLEITGPINILEFGAMGDGVADDAPVIQEVINLLAARGGGKIFFPYTPKGYRIARAANNKVDGHGCRGQLYIPYQKTLRPNIAFEGEMPCKLLDAYMVRDGSGTFSATALKKTAVNTFLFSDWDAPEEHDQEARPWSLLCGLEGDAGVGHLGVSQVSIKNLEFRVKLSSDKMYPTMSAVNLQNVSRINIQDSQFTLDQNVGDYNLGLELQKNPCPTAGLIASGDQNDNNVIRNSSAQGFRFGFVFGEHVVADYLYVHNNEEAIVFHDCSHQSHIHHVVAQHNQKIVTAAEGNLFGMPASGRPVFVQFDSVDFEPGGKRRKPLVSNMMYGVWDPENRIHGNLYYHCGCPINLDYFPIKGAKYFKCKPLNQDDSLKTELPEELQY